MGHLAMAAGCFIAFCVIAMISGPILAVIIDKMTGHDGPGRYTE